MLNGRRLKDFLVCPPREDSNADTSSEDHLNRFHHFVVPTLPHLLALLLHSPPSFPPKETSLLVVDSISAIFNHAFAQSNGYDGKNPARKNDIAQWAARRRWAAMADVISALGKLATMKNMAVLLTNQTTTKVTLESAASLQPAISGTAWDAGINYRLLLFWDWQVELGEESGKSDLRFAAATKIASSPSDGFGEVIAFTINEVAIPTSRR